jgi:hypothetical protein
MSLNGSTVKDREEKDENALTYLINKVLIPYFPPLLLFTLVPPFFFLYFSCSLLPSLLLCGIVESDVERRERTL